VPDDHSQHTVVAGGWTLIIARWLDAEQLGAAAELLAAVIRADGHRGVGTGALEVLGGDHGDALAVLAADDTPAGGALAGLAFGQVVDEGVWTVELTVRPDRRGQGLGGALLEEILDAAPLGTSPRVWAYRPGPVQQHLVERHGLTPIRYLLQLRGPTAGASVPASLAGSLRIRGFTAAEVPALVELHNAAFSYERLDAASANARLARSYMGPDHVLVAEAPDGRLAGYVWMSSPPPHGEGEGAGELVLLAVHPDWQGHHLGQSLAAAGLELLANRGVDRCTLYVDRANTPAVRVYERAGFTLHHMDILYGRP
jgi:mycothiol synthase